MQMPRKVFAKSNKKAAKQKYQLLSLSNAWNFFSSRTFRRKPKKQSYKIKLVLKKSKLVSRLN